MPAIEVRRLSKTFRVPEREPGLWSAFRSVFRRRWRQVRAVDEASFSVEEGELVGFLGANGAGKTTTLKMLSGLLHPSGGAASVLGFVPWKRRPEFQKAFSLVMGQRTQLWWELPAQETFRLNQKIYEIPEDEFRRSSGELVELLELRECLAVPVKKLSLGQRMRAELAVSLLHSPRALFLDEPTLGLDVVMQKRVRQFLLDYNRRHRATVLLTSHNMDDVLELCRRVLLIERGRIVYDGELRRVVERYAPHKLLRADFRSPPAREELGRIGRVTELDAARAVVEVPRLEAARRAAELLSRFEIVDLTIEETPLPEIVRRLFGDGAEGGAG